MLSTMLLIAIVILSISVLGCLYRVLRGPSMSDRIIALDTIGINLIAIVAVISIMLRTQAFLEIILLIGILAFLGTIAFSKYIERGVVIGHETDDGNN